MKAESIFSHRLRFFVRTQKTLVRDRRYILFLILSEIKLIPSPLSY